MTVWNVIASSIAGLIGAMGFGGGGILIIYLTQISGFGQLKSQGINLIFFIPTAIIALIMHYKNKLIDFKKTVPFIISAIPGVALGLYITTIISGKILSFIFGILLIIMGINELFKRN